MINKTYEYYFHKILMHFDLYVIHVDFDFSKNIYFYLFFLFDWLGLLYNITLLLDQPIILSDLQIDESYR